MLHHLLVTQPCPPDADNCPRLDNGHSGNFVSFGCAEPNEYNDLATIFFNTQGLERLYLYSHTIFHTDPDSSLLFSLGVDPQMMLSVIFFLLKPKESTLSRHLLSSQRPFTVSRCWHMGCSYPRACLYPPFWEELHTVDW